ncbi:hypothetical protein D3C84_1217590 [compost metagenome]
MLDQVDAAPGHPAQQSVQTRRQFAQVEWLEQVIVGSGLQTIDTIGDRVPRREDQHRNLQAVMAQLLQ